MIADSAEIKFACSQCGQSLLVDASGAGLTAVCPTCEHPVIVPQLSSIHDRAYGHPGPGSAADARRRGLSQGASHFPAVDVDAMRTELREVQRINAEFESQLAEAHLENEQLRQELESSAIDAIRRVESIELRLAEARNRIRQLEATLDSTEGKRLQLEGELAASVELARLSESRLAQRGAELDEVRARLASVEGEHSAATEKIRVLQADSERLRTELDSAARTAVNLAEAEKELRATSEKLSATEEKCRGLGSAGDQLRKEIETLRHDLNGTQAGRDLLELRANLQTTDAERQRTAAALSRVQAEAATLAASEENLRAELAETRRRCADAEQLAEARSESQLKQDNETLRGIVGRQNVVLEERFAELRCLKRVRFVARSLYALLALAVIGLIAYAVKMLPHALRAGLPDWLAF